jgi:hypothetical protein
LPFSEVREFDTFLLTYNFIDFRIYDGLINTDATMQNKMLGWVIPTESLPRLLLPPPETYHYLYSWRQFSKLPHGLDVIGEKYPKPQ